MVIGARAVYNANSGSLLHTWPVAKGAGYLAVNSGLAAYAAYRGGGRGLDALRTIHLLNLSKGTDRIVARIGPGAPGVVVLHLDALGLAYAVDREIGGGPGLVVFKPMTQLR